MSEQKKKLRLGGMALRNGLLVHGPTHWAAAVRRGDGTIGVASGAKPHLDGALTEVPGLRGVFRIGEAMAVIPLVKRALPEARLPWQDATVAGAVAVAAIGGAALRRRLKGPGGEAAITVLSVLPSLVALRGGDLAAYHGVEHKAIGAYEQDADAQRDERRQDRQGGDRRLATRALEAPAQQRAADRRDGDRARDARVLPREPRLGERALDERDHRHRLADPDDAAQAGHLGQRAVEVRLLAGGDPDRPVAAAHRRGPVRRAVHQQSVAQRHAAEPQLLLLFAHPRSSLVTSR